MPCAENLKNSTPFAGTASCTTSTIAFTYGLAADPLFTCPLEQLDIWSQVWLAATGADKQDARFTWHRAVLEHLKEGKVGISLGPASATISALVDLGWKPTKPDHWKVDDATSIQLDNQPFTRLQILTRARRDMQCKLWAKAAEHSHGSGLELGPPSFCAARKAITDFKKRGLYSAAKAVEFSVVGVSRDPAEEDIATISFCNRCGKRVRATRVHCIYECVDNEHLSQEIFVNQEAVRQGQEGYRRPCLFLAKRNRAFRVEGE